LLVSLDVTRHFSYYYCTVICRTVQPFVVLYIFRWYICTVRIYDSCWLVCFMALSVQTCYVCVTAKTCSGVNIKNCQNRHYSELLTNKNVPYQPSCLFKAVNFLQQLHFFLNLQLQILQICTHMQIFELCRKSANTEMWIFWHKIGHKTEKLWIF